MIEHVKDVAKVVSEMSRVLKQTGFIHLEAPNYLWPYEPHVRAWCIPLMGKAQVKILTWLQGKGKDNWYVDHLQFVTPRSLEREFTSNGLLYRNLVENKIRSLFEGKVEIKHYKKTAKLINWLEKLGIGTVIVWFILRTGLHPSVLYLLSKQKENQESCSLDLPPQT